MEILGNMRELEFSELLRLFHNVEKNAREFHNIDHLKANVPEEDIMLYMNQYDDSIILFMNQYHLTKSFLYLQFLTLTKDLQKCLYLLS